MPDRELASQFAHAMTASRAFQILSEFDSYPSHQALEVRLRQTRPDVVLLDLATSLAIVGDETLRLVAVDRRLGITVVVHDVGLALDPDRRRHHHLLALLQDQHRIALGHVGLGFPIQVVPLRNAADPGRRVGRITRPQVRPIDEVTRWRTLVTAVRPGGAKVGSKLKTRNGI